MENVESSIKVLSVEEEKKEVIDRIQVHMTKEKQDYIKGLIFSALDDPRDKYQKATMDDLEAYWKSAQGC
jgi:hypothetical protein